MKFLTTFLFTTAAACAQTFNPPAGTGLRSNGDGTFSVDLAKAKAHQEDELARLELIMNIAALKQGLAAVQFLGEVFDAEFKSFHDDQLVAHKIMVNMRTLVECESDIKSEITRQQANLDKLTPPKKP